MQFGEEQDLMVSFKAIFFILRVSNEKLGKLHNLRPGGRRYLRGGLDFFETHFSEIILEKGK